jgi:3-phenylpropionate/cinnamic acid dioxygenase small subunit
VADSDVVELNRLAYRYAAAVDACDVDAFLDVFDSDARLRSYQSGSEEPFADVVGHEQLASIPSTMADMFGATFHQMTNHLVDVEEETATGSVLCTARHLSKDRHDRTAVVVVIRYVDRYTRHSGTWRIADRQIRFLWTERHTVVDDSNVLGERGRENG